MLERSVSAVLVHEPVPLRAEDSKPATMSRESASAAGSVPASVIDNAAEQAVTMEVVQDQPEDEDFDADEDSDYRDDYDGQSSSSQSESDDVKQLLRDSLHRTHVHSLNKPL